VEYLIVVPVHQTVRPVGIWQDYPDNSWVVAVLKISKPRVSKLPPETRTPSELAVPPAVETPTWITFVAGAGTAAILLAIALTLLKPKRR